MRRRAFARLIMPDEYLAARGPESVMTELEQVFGRPLWQAPAIADVQLRALRTHDERERLQELAALRCIVMSGRHDPIATHAANAALATGLGARHRIWGDASHALPIQHARAVNAVLRGHFAAGQK
jgi:pimeloyl-ACP methyl ester carboxylesterase